MAKKKDKELEVKTEVKEEVEVFSTREKVSEEPVEIKVKAEEPVVEEEKVEEVGEEVKAEPEYKTPQEMTPQEYRHYMNTGKRPLKQ